MQLACHAFTRFANRSGGIPPEIHDDADARNG
jgi:hypothetical protein